MMKDRIWLFKRMFGVLQFPEQALLSEGHIEIIAGQQLVIDNVRAIAEYTQSEIVLILPEGNLKLTGENLGVDMFSDKKIIVRGQLRTMQFE